MPLSFSKTSVDFTDLPGIWVIKWEVIHKREWLISLRTCGFWLLLTDSLPASEKSELVVH